MQRFLKVYLFTSTLFVLALTSCKTYQAEGELLHKTEEKKIIPYFDSLGMDYLYRAHITVFENEMKGILVVKKLSEAIKRVALVTDFGNTLIDFQIADDKVELEYAIDDLRKPMVINKLKKYFHFLVNSDYDITDINLKKDTTIFVGSFQSGRIFIYQVGDQTPNKLQLVGKRKVRADLFFYAEDKHGADSIFIKSYEFPFEMHLKRMESN